MELKLFVFFCFSGGLFGMKLVFFGVFVGFSDDIPEGLTRPSLEYSQLKTARVEQSFLWMA